MSKLFSDFDKSLYMPLFNKDNPLNTEEAIKAALILNAELHGVFVGDYMKIPHAISSIFYHEHNLRIDVSSTADHATYLKEENKLAPPEARTNQHWRGTTTRLTYLSCQLCAALLVGELPLGTKIPLYSDKIITPHTYQQRKALQKFFDIGLAQEPQKRYQNFIELGESLEWLLSRLTFQNPSTRTTRNLPKIPKTFYQNVVTKRLPRAGDVAASGDSPLQYELQIWNPRYQNAAKTFINTPSCVRIGRKTRHINKDTSLETTQIDQMLEEGEDGIIYYTILVSGDQCLSRKHVEISLPKNLSFPPQLQDLGSTHGVMIFRDSSRSVSNSVFLYPRCKSVFVCPEDQHFKAGNTYIRVRPLTSDSNLYQVNEFL